MKKKLFLRDHIDTNINLCLNSAILLHMLMQSNQAHAACIPNNEIRNEMK